ncbi:(2Fe-2S)-binding protein [Yoonia sp. BS5-3]|uniref:(2Fe-2S)-binding protein n=1 Tax=Yoonia phaeophyticola TaxID=3137369 RepID=A0ABZ2V4S7_9RHOB
MPKTPITFTLNGAEAGIFVEPGQNLLEALRREAGDLSPKFGCGQGTCGSCTVLINGEPHLSCLTLAVAAQGSDISTTGGLGGEELHPLQKAFAEGFAAQCGFCTSGMLMVAKALLESNPRPTRDEVIEAISGNLCRCTGYEPIVDAILDAAARMQGRVSA